MQLQELPGEERGSSSLASAGPGSTFTPHPFSYANLFRGSVFPLSSVNVGVALFLWKALWAQSLERITGFKIIADFWTFYCPPGPPGGPASAPVWGNWGPMRPSLSASNSIPWQSSKSFNTGRNGVNSYGWDHFNFKVFSVMKLLSITWHRELFKCQDIFLNI